MIRFLVMDVDGTLTDGKIYMGKDGESIKAFDIKDGYGIKNILPTVGIEPIVITGRESHILEKRCIELGIKSLFQNVDEKLAVLTSKVSDLSEVAFIGDDLNDLECAQIIKNSGGLVGCPNDAVSELKNLSHFISAHNGGDGAVRDFINWIVLSVIN